MLPGDRHTMGNSPDSSQLLGAHSWSPVLSLGTNGVKATAEVALPPFASPHPHHPNTNCTLPPTAPTAAVARATAHPEALFPPEGTLEASQDFPLIGAAHEKYPLEFQHTGLGRKGRFPRNPTPCFGDSEILLLRSWLKLCSVWALQTCGMRRWVSGDCPRHQTKMNKNFQWKNMLHVTNNQFTNIWNVTLGVYWELLLPCDQAAQTLRKVNFILIVAIWVSL